MTYFLPSTEVASHPTRRPDLTCNAVSLVGPSRAPTLTLTSPNQNVESLRVAFPLGILGASKEPKSNSGAVNTGTSPTRSVDTTISWR